VKPIPVNGLCLCAPSETRTEPPAKPNLARKLEARQRTAGRPGGDSLSRTERRPNRRREVAGAGAEWSWTRRGLPRG